MEKNQAEESYLVFISHSEKDRWIARQISRLIEEKGRDYNIKTFLDEKDIAGGDSIHEFIRKNIKECSEFLVLLSKYSIDRHWVLIEIGAAWVLAKRITAIIDKVAFNKMPDIMTPDKAIDLNNFDEYLEQLLDRVKEQRK